MLVYRRVGVFKPLTQIRDVVGSFSKAMEREGEVGSFNPVACSTLQMAYGSPVAACGDHVLQGVAQAITSISRSTKIGDIPIFIHIPHQLIDVDCIKSQCSSCSSCSSYLIVKSL